MDGVDGDDPDFALHERWPQNLEGVEQCINDGKDPFQPNDHLLDQTTPFNNASNRGDFDALLVMAARPGTEWTSRFLHCRGDFVRVPVRGRESIRGLRQDFFWCGASFAGVEVMMMYGYRLEQRAFEHICDAVTKNPSEHNLNLLRFVLAHTLEPISPKATPEKCEMEQCLGRAIGGEHDCFFMGRNATSIAVAELLLRAGTDPNGYCFQGQTPYDFNPSLYQAIKNQDVEMVKLLMKFGADPSVEATVTTWTGDRELDIQDLSVTSFAEEKGMAELLIKPGQVEVPDPQKFAVKLRRDLSKRCCEVVSPPIVVAMMRATGKAPPVNLVTSSIIVSYHQMFYD